eukprot:jgi/Picsp_1/3832/NSC_01344-R1_cue domain containing protein
MIVALASPEQQRVQEQKEHCRRRRFEEVSGCCENGVIDDKTLSECQRTPLGEYNTFNSNKFGNAQKRSRFEEDVDCVRQSAHGFLRSGNSYSPTVLVALKALFPSMSDETIAGVLDQYGEDIDAAIKRLNELQLSAPGPSKSHEQLMKRESLLNGGSALVEKQTIDEAAKVSVKSEEMGPRGREKTAEEWVDLLVHQMSVAKNMDDAKGKATELLGEFEGAVLSHSKPHDKIQELERENALLKRAVGIQNARLHEMNAKYGGTEDIASAFEALKEKCQNLEMQNYSLQLHLKQATSTDDTMVSRSNPDVY